MNALKQLRVTSDYSQKDVAEALHISQQAISRWENGDARPRTAHLRKLAQLYGCTADDLLRDDPGEGEQEANA